MSISAESNGIAKPDELVKIEAQYVAAIKRWAEATGAKVVKVRGTYKDMPNAIAIVVEDVSDAKVKIIRPAYTLGEPKTEKPWAMQKASLTEESLKAAGIKFLH